MDNTATYSNYRSGMSESAARVSKFSDLPARLSVFHMDGTLNAGAPSKAKKRRSSSLHCIYDHQRPTARMPAALKG